MSDNPQQGNRGGQEYGSENNKSQRNQDSQRNETPPEKERLKKIKKISEQDEDDKFSPSEDEDYDAEDYVTD